MHALDGRAPEAHERVPLLLVGNRRALGGDDAVGDELLEAGERGVLGVDGLDAGAEPLAADCRDGEYRAYRVDVFGSGVSGR